jgi:hypothetical protein
MLGIDGMKRQQKPTQDQANALLSKLGLPAADVEFTARNRFILRIDGQWREGEEYEFGHDKETGKLYYEPYTAPIRQPDPGAAGMYNRGRGTGERGANFNPDDQDGGYYAAAGRKNTFASEEWEAYVARDQTRDNRATLEDADDKTDFARLGFDQAELLGALRKGRAALAEYVRRTLTAAGFDSAGSDTEHHPTVDAAVARVLEMFGKELDYIEERQNL